MSKTRLCHICGAKLPAKAFCGTCTARFKAAPDGSEMTVEERAAELELLIGPLEIPFGDLHRRIEQLVGRSVWTHEMAHPEQLVAEIRSGQSATFAEVFGKLPADKPVIVVGVD